MTKLQVRLTVTRKSGYNESEFLIYEEGQYAHPICVLAKFEFVQFVDQCVELLKPVTAKEDK